MKPTELLRDHYGWPNPYAPADRRYRTAKFCHARGVLPSFRRDDKATWTIYRYLEKLAAAYEPKQQVRVQRDYHPLAVAFRLHHGAMRRFRPLIEAYLLSGIDDVSLAKRVAAPSDVIDWFRIAFFDVERFLSSPQFVLMHLIRAFDEDGQTVLDTHRLWKLLGYTLGPDALDQLLVNTAADKQTFKVGGLAAWFTQRTEAVLRSKQFVAASNLNPDDQKHVGVLLKLLAQGLRDQKPPDDERYAQIEHAVHAMLLELPWCKGPELTPEPVQKWDSESVELRDEELMLVAAGEKPPHLEDLKGMTFPLASVKTPKPPPGSNKGK